jgi:O-methyltransferase involved in polyketide biosynthesis
MSLAAIDQLSPISKTLLIPLVGRAVAQRCSPGGTFTDAEAAAVVARIEKDTGTTKLAPLQRDRLIVRGTIRRTQTFDRIAQDFISRHPEATIVNLGAGLCTRFSRVDNGRIRWMDVDLPEVVELRRLMLPPGERQELVATDADWLKLATKDEEPVLVLSEGVLMFLELPDVLRLFQRLASGLPGRSEWAFDYLHPMFVRFGLLRPRSMRAVAARYRWGTTRLGEMIRTLPRLELLSDRAFSDTYSPVARKLERSARWLLAGPIFDVAHLRLREPG